MICRQSNSISHSLRSLPCRVPSLRNLPRQLTAAATGAASTRRFSGMSSEGLTESQSQVRETIAKICAQWPDTYWSQADRNTTYPAPLHAALAQAGYIGICMPEHHGGAGLGISEATVMLQTIAESGAGMAGAQSVHANVYATMPILKFGSDEQKERYLGPLVRGEERVCFGVTEPDTGLDTLSLKTRALRKEGGGYLVNGEKVWITNAQNSARMVLLARTADPSPSKKASKCLSLFYVDLERGRKEGTFEALPIAKMGGRAVDANSVYFSSFQIDERDRIGEEGEGFEIVLHGMNAERCLIAGEALGLGYAALAKASQYASSRIVFGRPIGKNQGIAHPLAQSWCELEAAKHLTYHAAQLYDRTVSSASSSGSSGMDGIPSTRDEAGNVGAQCNAAKYMAGEAAFKACERAVMVHGGMGYAAEYHVERYFRDSMLPRLAPVSREMILNFIGQRVLGLPKSY